MEHAASPKSTKKSNALISNDSKAGANAELVPNYDTAVVGSPVFGQDDPSPYDDSDHDLIPECAPATSMLNTHNSPTAPERVPTPETVPTKATTPTPNVPNAEANVPKPNIATKAILNILMDTSSNCQPSPHLAPVPAALDQIAAPLPAVSVGIATAPAKVAGTDPPNKLGMAGAQTQNMEHATSLKSTTKSNELIPDDSAADVGPPDSKSARPTWKVNGQDDSKSNKEKLKAQICGLHAELIKQDAIR